MAPLKLAQALVDAIARDIHVRSVATTLVGHKVTTAQVCLKIIIDECEIAQKDGRPVDIALVQRKAFEASYELTDIDRTCRETHDKAG